MPLKKQQYPSQSGVEYSTCLLASLAFSSPAHECIRVDKPSSFLRKLYHHICSLVFEAPSTTTSCQSFSNRFNMSGIEVAGLVLGAIPLVISGLEHYGQCAQLIKSIRDYPKEFATMSRRLRMEYATFRNTMELILSSCVRGRSLEQMLTDPGGKPWEEAEIEQELRHILQTSHAVFIETVLSMNETLTDFMGRLRLGPDGKVRALLTKFLPLTMIVDCMLRGRSRIPSRSRKRTSASTSR